MTILTQYIASKSTSLTYSLCIVHLRPNRVKQTKLKLLSNYSQCLWKGTVPNSKRRIWKIRLKPDSAILTRCIVSLQKQKLFYTIVDSLVSCKLSMLDLQQRLQWKIDLTCISIGIVICRSEYWNLALQYYTW